MDSLNQIEIQNIRHIVSGLTGACSKITYYKTLTSDENLTELYDRICAQSDALKQELTNIL
ncbi:MAG: hypothetical protein PHR25_00150 [Clostridia bacterium]|nr:hypothetical protein [Clostridia bacterium]MDD4375186.1 hypothetical protein [Clostridia bacterium]